MNTRRANKISMTVILCMAVGVSAFAQSPSSRPMLTASVGSPVAGSSNPSGFMFVPTAPATAGSPSASQSASASGVLGFQAWKQLQVDEARKGLEKLQAMAPGLSKIAPAEIAKNPKLQRLDQRMRQLQLNVEVAQELTLNDYFLIYLSQFKSKELLTDAAKHLTSEEIGELLLDYQRSAVRADQVDAPANGLLTGVNRNSRPSATSRETSGSTGVSPGSKEARPRFN